MAWYEYNESLDTWFLAYNHNPKAKTRPLVFGDTTPQPTQSSPISQENALDTARRLFDAGWKACAKFCDRDDVIYDGIVGSTGCPEFETAFDAVWAAQQDKL